MAPKKEATILSRTDILSADDLKRELVEVPEWGGCVYVQTLNGAQRDAWESRCIAARKGDDGPLDTRQLKAQLVVGSLFDADGKRLFNDNDVGMLNDKSGKVIDNLFQVCQKMSSLSDEDVDELAGNSSAAPSGGSGSSSPASSGKASASAS